MDLVQAIRRELDQAAGYYQQDPYNGTGWTSVTHEKIGNLAQQFAAANGIGCGTPSGPSIGGRRIEVSIVGGRSPAIRGGFLFDQSWLTWCDDPNSKDHGYCVGCDLAVETEFSKIGDDEFYRDFLKLVLTKANVKVMVFWTRNICNGEEIVAELERQLMFFRDGERRERYLISLFCWDDTSVHRHEVSILVP
jgi:hypothetical protein